MVNQGRNNKAPTPKPAWGEEGSALLANIINEATHSLTPFDTLQERMRTPFKLYATQADSARTQKQITKMPVINSPIPAGLLEDTNTILAHIYILSTYNVRYLIAILNNKALQEVILPSDPKRTAASKGEQLNPSEKFRNDAYKLFCIAYGLQPQQLTDAIKKIKVHKNSDNIKNEAETQLHILMRASLNNPRTTNEQKRKIFLNLYQNYDRKYALMLSTNHSRECDEDAITTVLSYFCPKNLPKETEKEKLKVKNVAAIANRLLQTELRDPNFSKALDYDILSAAIRRINDPASSIADDIELASKPQIAAATRAIISAFQDQENGVALAKLCLNNADIGKRLETDELHAFAKYNASLALDIINNPLLNTYIQSENVAAMIETHKTSQALAKRAFKKPWFGKSKSYQFTDTQLISMAIKSSSARDEILKNRELCFRILKAATPEQRQQLQNNSGRFLQAATRKISTTRFWQTNYVRLLTAHQQKLEAVAPESKRSDLNALLEKQRLETGTLESKRSEINTQSENLSLVVKSDTDSAFEKQINIILKSKSPAEYLKENGNLDWVCLNFSKIADELKNASADASTKLRLEEFLIATLSKASLEQEDKDTLTLLKGNQKTLSDNFSRLELSLQEDILTKTRQKTSETLREESKSRGEEDATNETATDLQRHLERHVALRRAVAQLEDHNLKMKPQTNTEPTNGSKRSESKSHEHDEIREELKEQVESITLRIKFQESKQQQELKRVLTLHEFDDKQNKSSSASPLYHLFVELFEKNQLEHKLTVQQQLWCSINDEHIKNFILAKENFPKFFTTFSKMTDEELSDFTKDEAGQKFIVDLLKMASDINQQFIADHLTACLPCVHYLTSNTNTKQSDDEKKSDDDKKSDDEKKSDAALIKNIHLAYRNKKPIFEEQAYHSTLNAENINKIKAIIIKLDNGNTGTLNDAIFCLAYLKQPLATLKKQPKRNLCIALQTICIKNQAFNFDIKKNTENLEYIMGTIFNKPASELSTMIDQLPASFSKYIMHLLSTYLAGKYDQTKADIFCQAFYKFTSDSNIERITNEKKSPGRYALLTLLSQHSIKFSSDWEWNQAEQLINMMVKYRELFHKLNYAELESERANGNPDDKQARNMEEWGNENNITSNLIQDKLAKFRLLLQQDQTLELAFQKVSEDIPVVIPLARCIVNDSVIRLALFECLSSIEAFTERENSSNDINKTKRLTLEDKWGNKEIQTGKPLRKTSATRAPKPKFNVTGISMPMSTNNPLVTPSNSEQEVKQISELTPQDIDNRKHSNSLHLSKIQASLKQAAAKAQAKADTETSEVKTNAGTNTKTQASTDANTEASAQHTKATHPTPNSNITSSTSETGTVQPYTHRLGGR